MTKRGKVYLVGAGIGDEKNITVKGKEILQLADVIVYDRLLNPKLLDITDSTKQFINVGKESANHLVPQDEINNIIVKKAKEGKIVARLKGGDPYVFGRGGEEAQKLFASGIDFEVVPGITSGVAGLCYAGIPITHRDYGSSLHFITGHLKNDDDLDYTTLAKLDGTIVFYMGLSNLNNIIDGLINAGKDSSTGCALVSHGGYPDQKVVCSTIKNIEQDMLGKGIKSPCLIVVGNVVELREQLNFYEKKPMFGKNVVVTRSRSQASMLSSKLTDLGANVIEVPSIEIQPINLDELSKVQNELSEYTHLVFTSSNAVNIFMNNLLLKHDIRAISNIKIFAIGENTSKELEKYHIKADFVPTRFVLEAFIEETKDMFKSTDRILLTRAKQARVLLKEELSSICDVTEVSIYDTIITKLNDFEIEALSNNDIDYITFTSSSTVKNFLKLIDNDIMSKVKKSKLISIGPITSKTIEEKGLKVYKQAEIFNIDSMIKIILEDK